MRIKVEFTLEINSKVIRAYISEMGDGESVKEFVTNSIMDAGLLNLDEGIKNAIYKDRLTGKFKCNER